MTLRTLYVPLLGACLLTLAIVVRSGMFMRKNPGEPINSAMRAALAETSPQLTTQDAQEIFRQFPTAYAMPSGLKYVNRDPGEGSATPRKGDTVVVRYSGRLLDGSPVDNSADHGGSITLRLEDGQIIPGWLEGLLTMKKGAKRTLIIPYWLGYGDAGRPPIIPPRATLVFDVELLDFH